jgi:hypothetical protein
MASELKGVILWLISESKPRSDLGPKRLLVLHQNETTKESTSGVTIANTLSTYGQRRHHYMLSCSVFFNTANVYPGVHSQLWSINGQRRHHYVFSFSVFFNTANVYPGFRANSCQHMAKTTSIYALFLCFL